MNNIPVIFNRSKVKKFRDRAAGKIDEHDFLLNEVSSRMVQSLDAIKGGYENILHIGCGGSHLNNYLKGREDAKLFVSQDLSYNMARRGSGLKVVADEETMPYAKESFDLVIANLVLHNVNDLPGTFIQIRKILKKDGVFIATFFGVDTLKELRQILLEVENDILGGSSPRIFPFTDVKTMGSLLQRAGFSEPVADVDNIAVAYDNVLELMNDVRYMGEGNALIKRGKMLNRQVLVNVDNLYKEQFSDGEGGIISTFNIINITGLAAFGG